MTTWDPVEPLIENTIRDTFAGVRIEPWRPKIGDRVRVRLNGECPYQFRTASVERGGEFVSDEALPHKPGHDDAEHNRTGRIAHIVGEGLLWDVDVRDGHDVVVDYDRPLYDATGPVNGKTYAATELEPLA